jgi:hypothetical protein
MSRHQDNRQRRTLLAQLILKVKPAHAGQANVENEASRLAFLASGEKISNVRVNTSRISDRPEEIVEGRAHTSIVVKNMDDLICRFRVGEFHIHHLILTDAGKAVNKMRARKLW